MAKRPFYMPEWRASRLGEAVPALSGLVPPGQLASLASAAACTRLARRRGAPVLRARRALLETPPFRRAGLWSSACVDSVHLADGTMAAGSMERALDAEAGHDGLAAAARLVSLQVGGSYWADAPKLAGSAWTVVAAGGSDQASRTLLAAVLARGDAARTLLIAPAGLPATLALATQAGCRSVSGPADPWAVLGVAAELHIATDEPIAWLALLAGCPVHCHGTPWFSGRGLTVDHAGRPAKPPRSLDRFAAAALLDGVGYADPFTAAACPFDQALDRAAEWRRVCRANRRVAACVGMQFWKRRRMAQFLHTGLRAPGSHRSAQAAVAAASLAGGAVASWASRMPADLPDRAAAVAVPVVRVEDGFLRSVGLGSDFMLPCSIVLDGSGLYYDPTQPSDLETLLSTADFTPDLLRRSRAVMQRITQAGLTKYNTGGAALPALPADGRTCILVIGQVADDLSVQLGGGAAADNADLLARVRALHPDAFILYRPHPDVDAGHRPGAVPDAGALRLADGLARGVPMGALIAAVDEVHTMTSLAGFEALLRGRRVVAWGRPFYAGWGLTADKAAIPRRTRRLRIEELAAGVLLLYPRYLDPVTLLPCPAEVLIDRLTHPELWRPTALVRLRRLQGRAVRLWRDTKPHQRDAAA